MADYKKALPGLLVKEGVYDNDLSKNVFNFLKLKLSEKSFWASEKKWSKRERGTKKCSVEKCHRGYYSMGFCEAHYQRNKNGKPLNLLILSRLRNPFCGKCGTNTDNKGGWGLCKKCFHVERPRFIKDCLVDFFGRKCFKCKGVFENCAFDFHHKSMDKKDASITISFSGIGKLANEISKCVLLCANCHRIIHFSIANSQFKKESE